MKEPYRTLWLCLMKNNWQYWGQWRYGVKAKLGEAIYIGDDRVHLTILANTYGYHKTVNGRTGQQDMTVRTLDALMRKCRVGAAFDITPTIGNALKWFKANSGREAR